METSSSPLSAPAAIVVAGALVALAIIFTRLPAASPSVASPAATARASAAPVVDAGHLPVLGNADAPVTIVEFADFRCSFCEKLHKDAVPQIQRDYVDTGTVKFAFRHFPILGPASMVAANAAECANAQGTFWEFHNYLYDNQPSESDTSMYTVDAMTEIAGTLGLKTDAFRTCLAGNTYAQKITDDLNAGRAAGVTGTPATFVNGQLVSGAAPYASFKAVIDAALVKAGKT